MHEEEATNHVFSCMGAEEAAAHGAEAAVESVKDTAVEAVNHTAVGALTATEDSEQEADPVGRTHPSAVPSRPFLRAASFVYLSGLSVCV